MSSLLTPRPRGKNVPWQDLAVWQGRSDIAPWKAQERGAGRKGRAGVVKGSCRGRSQGPTPATATQYHLPNNYDKIESWDSASDAYDSVALVCPHHWRRTS